MGTASEFVTTREAAELLGVSKSRVDQFVREGRLSAVPFGNARMIPRAAVLELKKAPRSAGRPPKADKPGPKKTKKPKK